MEFSTLGIDIPIWSTIILILLFILYKYTTRTFSTFKQLGIPGPTPMPVTGNMLQVLRHGLIGSFNVNIEKYGKVVGMFVGSLPVMIVADVDMLKDIQVKGFLCFTNRHKKVNAMEKPLNKMVSVLKDDEWRSVRHTITPAFSAGKLRQMVTQMNRCSKLLVDNLKEKAQKTEPFDVKDHMGSFSMDVIASTAFGLDIDSQRDPNEPFITHAKKSFNFSLKNPILILIMLFPFLIDYLKKVGYSFFPRDTTKFFTDILNQAMESRGKTDSNTRADFLQLMVNAHLGENEDNKDDEEEKDDSMKHPKKGLTHDEALAQGFIFFVAGYMTVSDSLTFTLYLLATYPDVQDKILQDIQSVLQEDQDPDYDSLHQMPYLDMVISESLRLYPPLAHVNRECNKDTIINGIHIPKGMVIAVPIQYLHMDPQVWPEPENFVPERFSPEAKAERNPFSWQPFGMGPRHCIGMRLALMELKMALVYLVRRYKVLTCSKTNIPIRRKSFGPPVEVYLTLEERV